MDDFERDENCRDDWATKFIDSINYIPMRLSDLPKTFRLRDTSDKGTFPHLFNTKENQTYIEPLPKARYSPEQIKPADREQFLSFARGNDA